MAGSESVAGSGLLVLGVDTCGPSGSVALARVDCSIPPLLRKDGAPDDASHISSRYGAPESGEVQVLGQTELAGKTYSATLVSAVEGLLTGQGVGLAEVGAIVVVNGPGSFTGVRVGLSAVKGLAEPGRIPVVAVSRLEVLAAKAGVESAALDAHRHEVFLRVGGEGGTRELLAGMEELSHISSRYGAPAVAEELSHISSRYGAPDEIALTYSPVPKSEGSPPHEPRPVRGDPGPGAPGRVAVCEDAAAEMVSAAWSGVELVRVEAPTAADAIRLCVPAILAGGFADLASLDGHYLRRSDAEIFGEAGKTGAKSGKEIRVRRMEAGDVDAVMKVAELTDHAARWGREAYVDAVDPERRPRRVSLVAEDGPGGLAGFVVAAVLPAGDAELESIVTALPHQRRGVARELFASLKHELRRQGVREVMLEVRDGNRSAQGFYRFLGFKEEGRRREYYADPVEDAVLMRLRLV